MMKQDIFTRMKSVWLVLLKRTWQQMGMIIFMEGTYQRECTQEFTKVRDIVMITQLDVISDLYQVKRTVVKEYLFDTIPSTQTHEKEEWFAVYNSTTKQLQELNSGRECSFYPTKSLMLMGNNAYQKISLNNKL